MEIKLLDHVDCIVHRKGLAPVCLTPYITGDRLEPDMI